MKKHIFGSNLFKNKDFFKISKTDDYLNYLAKFVEQLLSKPHLDESESAKCCCDVTKVENFEKNQKKHFRFGSSKSPVKGLIFSS
jgi:hypothetical protein